MGRRYSTVRAAAAATVVGVGLLGCSPAQDGETDIVGPVSAAVTALQDAFAAGDMRALCRRLTEPAQRQAGSVAHGLPTVYCEQDLRRAFRIIEDGDGFSPTQPVIKRVAAHEAGATVTLDQAGRRWKADVPLIEHAGRWKLAGFFGADPARIERIEKAAQASSFPSPRGRQVEVTRQSGEPCPALSDTRYPSVGGGCSFIVSSKSVPIRMLTPFGDFKFADCGIRYRVSVDASGRTWTDRWGALDTTTPGCSDIDACKADSFDYHPWRGRLIRDADGSYLHHMDLCLRTCIGSFAGEIAMRMTPTPNGWRVRQTNHDTTGFRIDGDLAISGGALRLSP